MTKLTEFYITNIDITMIMNRECIQINPKLAHTMNNFVLQSMSWNINMTYGSDIKVYLEFGLNIHIDPFLIKQYIMILFITWRTETVKYNSQQCINYEWKFTILVGQKDEYEFLQILKYTMRCILNNLWDRSEDKTYIKDFRL